MGAVRRVLWCVPAVIVLSSCGGGDDAPAGEVEPEVEQAVVDAATGAWALLDAARTDPSDQDKIDAAIAAYTGPAARTVTELLTNYGVTGQVSRPDTDTPATIVPYPDTVEVATGGDEATVELCEVDTNVLVQPGTGEGGSDVVVDDDVASHRLEVTLRLVDGVWLESAGEILETFEGATTCPDLP